NHEAGRGAGAATEKRLLVGAARQLVEIQRRFYGARAPAASDSAQKAALMRYMLDTNICIYVIKRRPEAVLEKFTAHPVGDLGLSIVTLAELEYGVARSSQTGKNRAALEQFVSPLEIAAFDREAASVYGSIRAAVERRGSPVGSMDLLI